SELRFRLLRQARVVVGMALAQRAFLTGRAELLQRELANRVEHQEPWLPVRLLVLPQQALVYKRAQAVQQVQPQIPSRVDHRLDRLKRAAADEDCEPPEELLFFRGEEVVAPGDRGTQGLMPAGEIARAPGQ